MALFKQKITLNDQLWKRIKVHVEEMGYSSVEEFVAHCIEKELDTRQAADQEKMDKRLKGLGYIE
jgi:metal-responsive CopG/Arc/MetJ family transcriptional regulator